MYADTVSSADIRYADRDFIAPTRTFLRCISIKSMVLLVDSSVLLYASNASFENAGESRAFHDNVLQSYYFKL